MTHEKLVEKVNPIIDEMNKNGYNYLIVAGKDGTCMRYLNGLVGEVRGMMLELAQKNDQFAELLKSIVGQLNSNE